LSKITGWLGPTKKDLGVVGRKVSFFSYEIFSWMKTADMGQGID
jgi:hypothetical protein